ncbi:hypothetical protein [Mycoplasma suis]|uniref:Uncharacterized protein n=1 Tax=Mycoplasma suis (strain Illinois) TaxID=768700 RepID=F0QQ13_MYCSL|nr:hypothetical protein [Mycoplasma suis]ADX97583.1 hypothetical protein MSU_0039 [Mycoplasma suis str. Illinois]
MPLLGVSSKILLSTVIGIVGSGVIAGSVVASRNNNVNAVEKEVVVNNNPNNLEGQQHLLPDYTSQTKGEDSQKSSEILEDSDHFSPHSKVSDRGEPEALLIIREFSSQQPKKLEEQLPKQSLVSFPKDEESFAEKSTSEIVLPKSRESSRGGKKVRKEVIEQTDEEKWESEIVNREISLESLYKDGFAGSQEASDRSCILYRKEEEIDDDNFDITEGRTIVDQIYESCENQTTWSLRRFEKTKGKGFWVRGEIELVDKLMRSNWENLFVAGFAEKRETPAESVDALTQLKKDLCSSEKTTREGNINWLEDSCSFDKSNGLTKEIR